MQVGDTLWDIVERNDGVEIDEIIKLNNLSDYLIYPEMEIKIPIK